MMTSNADDDDEVVVNDDDVLEVEFLRQPFIIFMLTTNVIEIILLATIDIRVI